MTQMDRESLAAARQIRLYIALAVLMPRVPLALGVAGILIRHCVR